MYNLIRRPGSACPVLFYLCRPQNMSRHSKSKIQNPKSKIQNSKSKIQNPKSEIQNSKSKIQNPKSKIRNPKSKIRNPKSKIPRQNPKFGALGASQKELLPNDPKSKILKSGPKSLDFGFWIEEWDVYTTRQFSDGASRSEARILPGPPWQLACTSLLLLSWGKNSWTNVIWASLRWANFSVCLHFLVNCPSQPGPEGCCCEGRRTKETWNPTWFSEKVLGAKVDLRTSNLPRKPCGVSSFFCASTFAPRTFPENPVAFQVFFVSRPSTQNLPSDHVRVSIFFSAPTFTPKTFPENHVAFQAFLCVDLPFSSFFVCQTSHPEPSHKPCGISSFLCASTFAPRTFPESHVVFRFFSWVDLCTKNLPRKPCEVSSLFLCQPVHPDPSQKTMSLFKLFLVDLRTINSPRKPCIVSLFFGRSAYPPRTFPAHHVPFQVFALLFKATAFRNLNYNWNKYVRRGEGLQKHLMKPNALAQSSSHALADKGWPGRWHHSTTLCSPMQKIGFGPMCSPPCSASSFPAPPPSFLRFLRLPYASCFPGNLPGSAATGASLFYVLYIYVYL